MTTTAAPPIPTSTRAPGSVNPRRTAFVAGAFYLLTFASSIPAVFFLAPVLDDPGYVTGAGADTRVVFGLLLDVVNVVALIGTAVALFPLLKRQSEGLALGFVTSRVMEGAVIMVGVASLLAVVTLRQDGAAAGAGDDGLVVAAQSLVAVRDWTLLLGPGLAAAVNALLLGTLMYRSGLVPRAIPVIGLIGAPLLLASVIATLFGIHGQFSQTALVIALPIMVWELSVGSWMLVKGFKPAPILQQA